ncbi:hypothetical protein [Nocardiopsis sp. NPDC058789]|uniref:hypothetical protein n=1 Tax=Nocardiopsis sp. NPDC058789 TaxID=3346634 RepID=UPI00366E9BF7
MSLAEIEAYERERELRRKRIRLVLSWTPLAVAVLLLVVGGVAVWSASSGHDEDRAQVATLVEELQEEDAQAQAEFRAGWIEALESSSSVRVERVETDSEWMRELLLEVVEAEGDVSVEPRVPVEEESLLPAQELADQGVPGLGPDARASLGEFSPVVVESRRADYSYFAYVEVFDAEDVPEDGDDEEEPVPAVATLSVAWTTDYAGMVTHFDVQWTDEAPQQS